MQASNNTEDAVLTTLAGIAGLVPESILSIGPADATKYVTRADVRVIGRRPIPPDPPPPRA
jgi:hypothetical protein